MSEIDFTKFISPVLTFLLGIIGTEIIHRFWTSASILDGVSQRYITEMQGNHMASPTFRLGAMQRVGVALLKPKQIHAFVSEVTGRNCSDPFEGLDLGQHVPFEDIPSLLRDASVRGITLNDDAALADLFFSKVNEVLNQQTHKRAKTPDKQ